MHPILFKPFGFAIYSYSLALLVAFIAGIALAVKIARSRGPTDAEFVQEVGMMGVIWGLLGGRVGWVLWEFGYYSSNPMEIFNLRAGGMTILGGIVVPIIALFIYFKRKGCGARDVLDVYAAPLLLGMAIGRFGCILHGCCFGKECDPHFPLSLTYPAGSLTVPPPLGPRYASQFFETLADLALMAFIIWFIPRLKFAGQGIFIMLSGYGVIRFFNEMTRDDIKYIGPITLAQWVALAMFAFGVLGLLGVWGKPPVDNSWQKGFDGKAD